MLKITRFIVNPFQENTYVVFDADSHDAAVVDPGMLHADERKFFDSYIADNNLRLQQIILTHAHLDHCFGANYVRGKYNVQVKANQGDRLLAKNLQGQARRFGLHEKTEEHLSIDIALEDGDLIEIGSGRLNVIAVPGHSPGGISLYCPKEKFVFTGDSLFEGSIGRTDLDGGDHSTLVSAIANKLLTLPDDTTVLPGHGNPTTIGKEKAHNPYL